MHIYIYVYMSEDVSFVPIFFFCTRTQGSFKRTQGSFARIWAFFDKIYGSFEKFWTC